MISKQIQEEMSKNSIIRAMFEDGKRLKAEYGEEKVWDFSLGNPCAGVPNELKEAIIKYSDEPSSFHGYMSNAGFQEVRDIIAQNLENRFKVRQDGNGIIMTTGAAGALNVIFKTLIDSGDEVMVLCPYFGEYRGYVKNYNGVIVEVPMDKEKITPSISEIEKRITEKTKALIINTPNNPSGIIYSKSFLEELAELLTKKETEYKHEIYIVSDEPYRELIYDNEKYNYIPNIYSNTIVAYSFSKSFSLAGERIGYVAVHNDFKDKDTIVEGLGLANRILGFVNAPAFFQRVVADIIDCKADIEFYNKNRVRAMEILDSLGIKYIKPDGAFYLFVKTPIDDDREFCNIAKKNNLLLVPGSAFGGAGYVRLAYCVQYDRIDTMAEPFKATLNMLGGNK